MIKITAGQAKHLKETGSLTTITPLIKQPSEGYEFLGHSMDEIPDGNYTTAYFGNGSDVEIIKLRYPVGKVVACKEPWDVTETEDGHIQGEQKTVSATVIASRICPVRDVTAKEAYQMGITMKPYQDGGVNFCEPDKQELINTFNSLYGKPRFRKSKNGNFYECWAWDMQSWLELYFTDDRYDASLEDYSLYWNNLPLTVHTDPCWVEVTTLKVER